MRFSRMVSASARQCQSHNSPLFDPSILRHTRVWGTADETVFNTVTYIKEKIHFNLLYIVNVQCRWYFKPPLRFICISSSKIELRNRSLWQSDRVACYPRLRKIGPCFLRWKSQRTKSVGRHRFSIDFSFLGLAYCFLSRSLIFILAITNIWQNFGFAVEIFKIHRQVWIFMRIFVCLESIS